MTTQPNAPTFYSWPNLVVPPTEPPLPTEQHAVVRFHRDHVSVQRLEVPTPWGVQPCPGDDDRQPDTSTSPGLSGDPKVWQHGEPALLISPELRQEVHLNGEHLMVVSINRRSCMATLAPVARPFDLADPRRVTVPFEMLPTDRGRAIHAEIVAVPTMPIVDECPHPRGGIDGTLAELAREHGTAKYAEAVKVCGEAILDQEAEAFADWERGRLAMGPANGYRTAADIAQRSADLSQRPTFSRCPHTLLDYHRPGVALLERCCDCGCAWLVTEHPDGTRTTDRAKG